MSLERFSVMRVQNRMSQEEFSLHIRIDARIVTLSQRTLTQHIKRMPFSNTLVMYSPSSVCSVTFVIAFSVHIRISSCLRKVVTNCVPGKN